MNPETKLKLAKMMGKECWLKNHHYDEEGNPIQWVWEQHTGWFAPDFNYAQLWECVEFLVKNRTAVLAWDGFICFTVDEHDNYIEGKTLKEVVLKALTAIVEEV